MTYQTIDVKPLAGNIGAEVFGVDLSKDLDQQTFSEVHQAFLDHLVIFFRDQDISTEQQGNFVKRFGPLIHDPFIQAPEGQPEVMMVTRKEHETYTFGEAWHSDSSYMEKPPLGSFLYCLEAPDVGGDTMFANQYLAYDSLSEGMKKMLDGLTAIHTAEGYNNSLVTKFKDDWSIRPRYDDVMKAAAEIVSEHPVVRTHPETGRKALYVSRGYTRYFKGWSFDESRVLIDWLANHAVRPEFTCRFRWRSGSLAMWDNRCAQHAPLNDYRNKRRVMRRIVAQGDRPV